MTVLIALLTTSSVAGSQEPTQNPGLREADSFVADFNAALDGPRVLAVLAPT